MTRRLVDASQEVIIREEDCQTQASIIISQEEAITRNEPFSELIMGRTLAEDAVDARGNHVADAGTLIIKQVRDLLIDAEVEYVRVRSPLTCRTVSGVCQKCFGMDLSTREAVEIGSPVGIISSQSIGEPGTQLTMRTFHSG